MNSDYPTPRQIAGLRKLWHLSFGDSDEFLDSFFLTAFSYRRCRCITIDGQVVSALYWLDGYCEKDKIAYIYAAATHPDYRRQGLLRELMEDVHLVLMQQGYAAAMLVPADDGLRKAYLTMGFRNCTKIREFFCASQPESISIHSITRREYTHLRRAFLPEGSLLQEGESLLFLEQQSTFYTGPGFLLCAVKENEDILRGIELLGDTTLAPKILCTLGFAHGSFRTPGEQQEFAMYCPLSDRPAVPAYLGFSFD